jgi:hypothetical protein
MRYRLGFRPLAVLCGIAALGAAAWAQQNLGYSDTPFLPGGKWRVHDGTRPQPKVIEPGTFSTQDAPGKPPSDAIVLFDGKDLSNWRNGRNEARWKVENGYFEIVKGTGTLETKPEFGDCQIHIEWSAPNPPRGASQARGNSGVLIMNRYEVQVLDSHDNKTYPDGQAASIYAQYPPLVNAMRKPGEWNTYDIIFTAPRFRDGRLIKPAYATVIHNGVVVHNHAEILGPMTHRTLTYYSPHPE